jgi:hypothetical protein
MRQIEGLRLDELFRVAFEKALSNDKDFLLGIDRCLAVMKRRSRLFGLDMPPPTKAEAQVYLGRDDLEAGVERLRRIVQNHEAIHDLENCHECDVTTTNNFMHHRIVASDG